MMGLLGKSHSTWATTLPIGLLDERGRWRSTQPRQSAKLSVVATPSPSAWKTADRALIQIIDSAHAEAACKSGVWLACRPGCSQCCIGVFPISQLDVRRLQAGLEELRQDDPARAARVVARARESVERLRDGFPGDALTGLLTESDEAEARFEDFANDEPCPALDPETQTCDLYASRPMTCRVFGPAVRGADSAVGACELCYQGASDAQIAECAVEMDPDDTESLLTAKLEAETGVRGMTIVAWCLAELQ
jgi:Fe-S-cluster containining protein